MSLPNRDSFDAKFFGRFWFGLDVPRHFSVFSVAHLSHAMLETGFEMPRTFTIREHLGSAHNCLFFAMLSLQFWLKGDSPPSMLRRRLLDAYNLVFSNPLASVLLFLLTRPYSRIVRLLNRGSQMTVVARKF